MRSLSEKLPDRCEVEIPGFGRLCLKGGIELHRVAVKGHNDRVWRIDMAKINATCSIEDDNFIRDVVKEVRQAIVPLLSFPQVTALFLACRFEAWDLALLLLNNGADPNKGARYVRRFGDPFVDTCGDGVGERFGGRFADTGQTPLWPNRGTNLKKGARVGDQWGHIGDIVQTPLYWAAKHGSSVVCRRLLECRAREKKTLFYSRPWSPLEAAIIGNHEEVARLLEAAGGSQKDYGKSDVNACK